MDKKKRYWSLLIIFAMMIQVFSMFLPKTQVYADESRSIDIYYGTAVATTAVLTYQGREAKLMDPLWINYPKHPEWSRISYCINMHKNFPKLKENIEYTGNKYDIEEAPSEEVEVIGKRLEKPRGGQQKAMQQIRNVLYRGFPLDGDGIQAKYGLSDDEFWHLTQMAIHFWSDTAYDQHGIPFTTAYIDYYNARPNNKNLTDAYNHLISETGTTAPNDLMLLLFNPNVSGYQHMVSADYQERKIEFSKVDDKGQPIGGVKFKIERNKSISNKLLIKGREYDSYEFEVGDDGKICDVIKGETFDNKTLQLVYGDYTLTEVNTPSGYEGLANPISFTIKSDGEILQEPKDPHIQFKLDRHSSKPGTYLSKIHGALFTVTNKKIGFDFHFKKINESGQPLKDVEFKIYKGEDEVSNFTSSEKDFETVTLPQGEYTLKETSPPDGYSAMPDMTFNVDDSGKLTFTTTDYEKYITLDENKTSVTIKNYPNTIEKPKSKISTQVEVNNQKSTKDKSTVLKITGDTATIDFKDYLTYEKLFAGETYDIVALLCEVKDDGTVIEPTFESYGTKITSKDFVANENGGVETIEFKNVEVKAGTKYVVMEMVTSRNKFSFDTGLAKHELSHKDKDDKAQTFIVEKIPTQNVTIEKKVTGASGDKQKEFTFNLKVNADEYLKNGDNLSGKLHKKDGQVEDVTITVGQNYSFSLKDGEHLELTGLFENSTYTLSETEYGKDGYTTTVMVNDTKKENADTDTTYTVVAGKNSVVFTNHNGKIVPTGILLDIMPYLVGIAFVGISGVAILLVRKKKRNSIM
ncbi:TPA: thioester-forming surface-anchored protein [Streptococcus equi subsp. zooepidemicus]|nr:thioester-forming surface-anchored protein [Streptococcus equi subsp. zooepidemicus]